MMFKNTADAIEFYMRALGAKEKLRVPRPDGRIMHAEIQIGEAVIMMADEAPELDVFSIQHYGGSPVSIFLYAEDCDALYRQAIDAGAKSVREPTDQPYGDRMAGIQDPFGYKWWIATHIKD